jgi:hypothetical protein
MSASPCGAAAAADDRGSGFLLRRRRAVGLVNSLRLVGHEEPIVLLDCGLTGEQRTLLADAVDLVSAPAGAPPTMLKTIAPLRHPAQTMVLIDTDMIVTRPLHEPLAQAAGGRVVAFENDTERHVPGWGELLELGPVRRQPYLSFGMVAMGGEIAPEVVRLLDARQGLVDFERTYWRERRITDYELLYADQDVLNAILASRVDADRVVALDQRLAPLPPFRGLRIVDERSLRCASDDGIEPYVIHHWLVKPWLEPTHHGVYSRLLRRLLIGDDVAIRVPGEQVPRRFRSGLRAYAERKRINAAQRLRYHVREPLAARRARP